MYQGPPAQEETYTDYAFTLGKFRSGTFNPENINRLNLASTRPIIPHMHGTALLSTIQLVVYANGRCAGSGKYMLVYYYIMQNHSDDHPQVQWPLEAQLSVALLAIHNLQDGHYIPDSIQDTYTLHDFTYKWNKPKSDREGGVGWGHDQFIDHAKLRCFLVNDTLYFYVTIN